MLESTDLKLDDQIVRAFAHSSSWTAGELHDYLFEDGLEYSLAAIYKAIRKLVAAGVLVGVKGEYRLTLTWLYDLQDLSEQCLRRKEERAGKRGTTPMSLEPGEVQSFTFSGLIRLNEAFSHLILSIISSHKGSTVFSWNPHPWFHLAQPVHESRYLECLKRFDIHMYKLVGGETKLDRAIARYWDPALISARFGDHDWSLSPREYCIVAKPYILSVKLPKDTTEAIDSFFCDTTDLSRINIDRFHRVFLHRAGRNMLRLEHNARKASRLEKRFMRAFPN